MQLEIGFFAWMRKEGRENNEKNNNKNKIV
jgi:hypothetical protein